VFLLRRQSNLVHHAGPPLKLSINLSNVSPSAPV
jgi:hypothetical protein